MMKRICDIILILLVITAIIVGGIIGTEYIRRERNEDKLSAVVAQIENINTDINDKENKQETIKLDGYDVEGIIEIPKIDIKYPIVSTTSDEAMKVAITKFWGANINDIGNFCMAGHNYKNGTMFGKTKYLKVGDKIKMTDLNLNTIEYEIFKIYTIDPNDITCIESVEPNTREITLITCTNGHKNRLITKAREVIK